MIELQWHEIVGAIVLAYLGYKCWYNSDHKATGDYAIPMMTPIYIFLLLGFLAFWGGIFWW